MSGKTGHKTSDDIKTAWPNLRKRETYDVITGILIESRDFNNELDKLKSGSDVPTSASGRKLSDSVVRNQGRQGGMTKAANAKAKEAQKKSILKKPSAAPPCWY